MTIDRSNELLKRDFIDSDTMAAEAIPRRAGVGPHALKPLRPLDRRPALVEQVVEQLRQGIIACHFPPESELPSEGDLAKSMGVSYTVIREAMRTLRSQGLVEVAQGRRPRVRRVGPEAVQENLEVLLRRSNSSLREVTELRRLLEVEIVAMAAERVTEEQVELMEEAIAEHQKVTALDMAIEADMRFHALLAQASGNMLFPLILSTVSSLLCESRRRTISRVGVTHAIEGHSMILEALRHHDVQAARAAMSKHIHMIVEDLGLPSEDN